MPRFHRGFTLIELLVVITIIVVLLAMLVPALDKAVYQATLVACGAQQRTMAGGMSNYAFDHKRYYPHKAGIHSSATYWTMDGVYSPGGRFNTSDPGGGGGTPATRSEFDYRPLIEDYYAFRKLFNDPVGGEVDFDYNATDPEGAILASYFLLDGWVYYAFDGNKSSALGQGMTKVGNRISWKDINNKTHRFNILAADKYHYNRAADVFTSGHPDREGGGVLDNRQNRGIAVNGSSPAGSGYVAAKYTYSHHNFFGVNTVPHATMDLNYAMQDGSVRRMTVEQAPVDTPYNEDHPLTAVPFFNEGNTADDPQNWILAGE